MALTGFHASCYNESTLMRLCFLLHCPGDLQELQVSETGCARCLLRRTFSRPFFFFFVESKTFSQLFIECDHLLHISPAELK